MNQYYFQNSRQWVIIVYTMMVVNAFWLILFLYRLFKPNSYNDCYGFLWFYGTYGNYLCCCFLILLFLAFPKRSADPRNFPLMEKAQFIIKACTFASLLYLVNNTTIIFSFIFNHSSDECINLLGRTLCHVTFMGSWILLHINCWYGLFLLWDKYGNLMYTLDDEQIQIELVDFRT